MLPQDTVSSNGVHLAPVSERSSVQGPEVLHPLRSTGKFGSRSGIQRAASVQSETFGFIADAVGQQRFRQYSW